MFARSPWRPYLGALLVLLAAPATLPPNTAPEGEGCLLLYR